MPVIDDMNQARNNIKSRTTTSKASPSASRNKKLGTIGSAMSSALKEFKTFQPVETPKTTQTFEFKAPEPFKYDQNTDPAYQSAIASAKANIAQSQADTNAFLRARGQGKSSYSESVANQIADKEMGRVSTEVLPQLISQAYQRYNDNANRGLQIQQANYGVQRDNVGDTFREAEMTGNYLPANARAFIDRITQLGEAWKTGTPEQRDAYHQEAEKLRASLTGMGIDPELFGSDKTTEQRLSNVARAGTRTLEGSQFDENKSQQEWENNFRQGQLDWQKAQQIWENAFQEKNFQQQMEDAAASRGLQWASLSQRQKEHIADSAFREKQFELEEKKFEASQSGGGELTDKESIDNYNGLYDDFNSPELSVKAKQKGMTEKELARSLLSQNKEFLNDSDYTKLNSWINEYL